MSDRRPQHSNARLTPKHRLNMVRCVLDKKWSVEATADRFQVDAKTVRKWVRRFEEEGEAGLCDRSSRPKCSPKRTPRHVRRQVLRLRNKHRWGADHIGHEMGLAASTVQNILSAAGVGRLDSGDRATREPVVRYQRDRPGELIHVDIKKIAAIPDGGGWRTHGRHEAPTRQRVGYRYLHSAIDDRTRIVYSETHDDEKAGTAVGFWHRAVNWYASIGITVERVLTDNGACYRSRHWINYNQLAGITVKKTRPYRPQTNGKIERFHRILLEELGLHPRLDLRSPMRNRLPWLHPLLQPPPQHGALQWATPTATLNQLPHRDNVPVMHN